MKYLKLLFLISFTILITSCLTDSGDQVTPTVTIENNTSQTFTSLRVNSVAAESVEDLDIFFETREETFFTNVGTLGPGESTERIELDPQAVFFEVSFDSEEPGFRRSFSTRQLRRTDEPLTQQFEYRFQNISGLRFLDPEFEQAADDSNYQVRYRNNFTAAFTQIEAGFDVSTDIENNDRETVRLESLGENELSDYLKLERGIIYSNSSGFFRGITTENDTLFGFQNDSRRTTGSAAEPGFYTIELVERIRLSFSPVEPVQNNE